MPKAGSGSDWGKVDASTGFEDKKTIGDLVLLIDKGDFEGSFKEYRFIGGVQPYQVIWLPIFKDGKPVLAKTKRPVRIPKYVTNYNLETHKTDESVTCPYVEVAEKMNKHIENEQDQLKIKQAYLANAIDREAQENPPKNIKPPTKGERKTGFYDIESNSTKMVGVFDMTPTLFRKVKGLKELNKRKLKSGETQTYNVTDPKFGCNVNVKYSPKEKGGAMYDAQLSARTPLDEDETEYPIWDISSIIEPDDYKSAKKEADRLWKEFAKSLKGGGKLSDEDEDNEDMPEDLEESVTKKKKSSKIIDDEEDEDNVKPKKKTKIKARVVEDDDEDDDPLPRPKKGKVKIVDPDDDDDPDVDLDSDDEDDEEEVKPKKKTKAKVVEEDEDEEDDEEPILKSKKKKVADEEEEDDLESLDDDDEDEDEDEEVVKPKKKKSKIMDDDEDDEEEVKPKKKKPLDDEDDD